MTAPKRMALAFGCMLLAIAIFGIMYIVPIALVYGLRHALPTLQMLPVYLLFAFPGWVLALPFVLLFKDADGWRAWTILAIGTAIGPAFLLTWSLLASGGRTTWRSDGSAVMTSLWIGSLTTVFYVALLRRFRNRSLAAPPSTI
jgi:hypothetical protein